MARNLYSMFFPETIAMVGASGDVSKHSGALLYRALCSPGMSKENIYAVNPKYDRIVEFEMPCYKSIQDLPIVPDVVFVAISAKLALNTLIDCGKKGVKNVVMITAGFKEVGNIEGEKELVRIAGEYGMNVLGPNCPGFASSKLYFGMTEETTIDPGGVVFISQSGGMNAVIVNLAKGLGGGCRLYAGIGNKAQLDEVEILESFSEYPETLGHTKVIALYLEGLDRPQEFLEVVRKLREKGIAVIVLKSGRSEVAQQAAFSHTGAMATSETALNALFDKAGVVRADTVHDFIAATLILEHRPMFETSEVAILTNSGGVGVVTTDALEQAGLSLTTLSSETKSILKTICEKYKIWYEDVHPIDLIGGGTPELFYEAATRLMQQSEVRTLIVSYCNLPISGYSKQVAEKLAQVCNENPKKQLIVVNLADIAPEIREIYQKAHVPLFSSPETAMRVLGLISEMKVNLDRKPSESSSVFVVNPEDLYYISGEINRVRITESAQSILGHNAQTILERYGLRFPETATIRNVLDDYDFICTEEFLEHRLAFLRQGINEVVVKVESQDIVHKSDAGGIMMIDLSNMTDCAVGFERFVANIIRRMPDADISGVLMQERIEGGYEVLIGAKKEPGFGHLITFGEGGIYTEIRQDIAFSLAPLSDAEARQIIERTRFSKILKGARGQEAADIDAIVSALQRISQLVCTFPQIAELDINPARVNAKGLVCLDARIAVE